MRSNATGRGVLWEVLAPIVRWPLYSPARLVTVIVVALLVVVGASTLNGPDRRPPARPTGAAAAPETPVGAGSSVGPSPPGPTSTSAQASPAMVQDAVTFTRAWARPTLRQRPWLTALRPLATDGFAAALNTVDPKRVPASRITPHAEVRIREGDRVEVEVGTNAGPVLVTLEQQAGSSRWLVSSILPATPERGEIGSTDDQAS